MLQHTFCHLPGVGLKTEARLWAGGFATWDLLLGGRDLSPRSPLRRSCIDLLRESQDHYRAANPRYFADRLPARELWRLYADFRRACAFLDIETTGLGAPGDVITTIALYDGSSIAHFVQGQDLHEFPAAVRKYKLLVTYNGKLFDLPFIHRYFGSPLEHAHIDLRFVLQGMGITGGLKGCERQLGVGRRESEGIDGWLAVRLWDDYRRRGNGKALESLLAYNVEDVVNLEALMVIAFNAKLRQTPFHDRHALPRPAPPPIPFRVDRETVDRLVREGWAGRPILPGSPSWSRPLLS